MTDGNIRQHEWRVTGMDCGSCAAKVRGAVERLPGVAGVDVALMTERLRLTLDEGETLPAQVEKAVRAIGFGIAPKGAAPERPEGGFVLPDGAFPDTTQYGSRAIQMWAPVIAMHPPCSRAYDRCCLATSSKRRWLR